ncbi:ribonuclease PH [Lentisphaera araneosa HTCC2155]|uniref:Ribonuclease PH n=1 Tax=Lentisphaera araneosa HTCC2155 TaxID=313628 RepID=A6DMF2_9BACT|nr:ribonuclease PH [Lentisphaera araneosa]EDM27142.1 ribonuclease PH [Lentisphaera araneosa HTCC2155]
MRVDGRQNDQLREIKFELGFVKNSLGSALSACGLTEVICTVNIKDGLPGWKSSGSGGWLTAEYRMLPGATHTRSKREAGVGGRSSEIQRLIGRTLRAAVDLDKLGDRTIQIDCDVLNADGGTRCASINGAMLALMNALKKMEEQGVDISGIIKTPLSAISVGVVKGQALLDLCYKEDSAADVDMNVIMTAKGDFVEVQGTGEEAVFSRQELNELLDAGEKGTKEISAELAKIYPEFFE